MNRLGAFDPCGAGGCFDQLAEQGAAGDVIGGPRGRFPARYTLNKPGLAEWTSLRSITCTN